MLPMQGSHASPIPLELTASPAAQRLIRRVVEASGDSLERFLDEASELVARGTEKGSDGSVSLLAAAFALSLVLDLHAWGASIFLIDGVPWIEPAMLKPNATADERARARFALAALKSGVSSYQPPSLACSPIEVLKDMSVTLVNAAEDETAADDFRHGVTTWTMPYRGREGRSIRFVMYGELSTGRIPLGLLEVGDDAPHNPLRDQLLGFRWNQSDLEDGARVGRLADRLKAIRECIRPDGLIIPPTDALSRIMAALESVKVAGKGRTGAASELAVRKRHTYLARLSAAENELRHGAVSLPEVNGGLRALRDITVPRVSVEATICGALPPFGPYLVGKLMVAMFAHPEVRALTDRPLGTIAEGVFWGEKLTQLLPVSGVLMVTTKGLWPGHSAQYNNASAVGASTPLKLKRIGDTQGVTASHVSDRTMKLAESFLSAGRHEGVSREFGSGGGKRQRTIERATTVIGLPQRTAHALIRRPVYAVSLVTNMKDVAVFNEEPQWSAIPYARGLDAQAYCDEALAMWRKRWFRVIEQRSGSAVAT
jgi:hypothetical protein